MLSRTDLFKGFAALAIFGCLLTSPALADTTVHEISAEPAGTHLLNLSIGNTNILKVSNPTDSPVCFRVPAYQVHEMIPAHNHKNIPIKTAQSMEPYAFYTIGLLGTKMESLSETNSWSSSSSSNISLEKIINYNTDYETLNDPEPLYYDSNYYQEPTPQPAKPARRMIRGYW
jgi:hypothetical protein